MKFIKQTDDYSCGPVAVINALLISNKHAGRAVQRQVAYLCDAKYEHKDGFCGTRPENIERAIQKFWTPQHHVGSERCSLYFQHSSPGSFAIFLYAKLLKDGERFYHYAMVHRTEIGWRFENVPRDRYFVLNTYLDDCTYPGIDHVVFPQIWSLGVHLHRTVAKD